MRGVGDEVRYIGMGNVHANHISRPWAPKCVPAANERYRSLAKIHYQVRQAKGATLSEMKTQASSTFPFASL